MSFHGLPARGAGSYERECRATGMLLAAALGLKDSLWKVTFQSRFGYAKWLQPYTDKTLTELGRALIGPARVKHSIKRVDRLLGNCHLGAERFELYQALARRVVGRLRDPLIVIDWSDLTPDRRWQLLRAAMPIGGRCLTLYEEIHPLTRFGNPRVHRAFLQKLKALLPEGVKPILITDAGFRAPWFKAVARLGWHWIGRIRNRTYLRPIGKTVERRHYEDDIRFGPA